MSSGDGEGYAGKLKQFSYFEFVQFAISVGFLLILIKLGHDDKDAQYDVMFLTLLSLACGSFFVFLPVSASLDLRWLKATGGAAIFGAIMWITVPNAQKHNEAHAPLLQTKQDLEQKLLDANKSIDALNIQNGKLISDLKDANERANKLQTDSIAKLGDADACLAQKALFKGYFTNISNRLNDVKSSTNTGIELSRAAASNTSDVATCTLRGSQAASSLKVADDNIQIIEQTVAAALGAAGQ
ncbi:hypothetical protein [Mesorhizobium sp. WSM4906]|uniref:hypothetical protein n=1 Tax=Mesorhizobium sp. WSM4906 TaxID=3038546 RepID=UPI0024166DCA|nr:hypothetical protein [Mesorhizobium sp. WSM4906]WFP74737.1 hypothetical protein QAZ22_23800 [Mesorhizobium sp. WSM4906]